MDVRNYCIGWSVSGREGQKVKNEEKVEVGLSVSALRFLDERIVEQVRKLR